MEFKSNNRNEMFFVYGAEIVLSENYKDALTLAASPQVKIMILIPTTLVFLNQISLLYSRV